MTESEWLACEDPQIMLEFLRGGASERKLRLFAVACCRQLLSLSSSQHLVQAVEAAERYADGLGTKAALKRARQGVRVVRHRIPAGQTERASEWVALWLAEVAASENAFAGVSPEIRWLSGLGLLGDDDRPYEVDLLRCIFGNPSRPVGLDPAWVSPTLVALAQTIYEERAFDRMPELADALEDAGCHEAEILDHCRQAGPHVRGCWVVDAVLGKS
jgi:hypothetical protein